MGSYWVAQAQWAKNWGQTLSEETDQFKSLWVARTMNTLTEVSIISADHLSMKLKCNA